MNYADTLVSIGLPVRNGAERIESVIESVLHQDHENVELVITDNASTDATEDICRDIAARDSRIVYHRHPADLGLLNNFVSALQLAHGTFYRWVGDDDWLDPRCISCSLDTFATDDRLLLVTTETCYIGPDGVPRSAAYNGTALGSDDPVTRFTEMLRLLNESYLLMDPLYGVFRREPVTRIERRNMLHEDQVFASKLALAGPWGHVPEVLATRHWKDDRVSSQARILDVPPWRAHFSTMLQCREILRSLDGYNLDARQRNRARSAVVRMYTRRKARVAVRRGRKLLDIARNTHSTHTNPTHIASAAATSASGNPGRVGASDAIS